VRGFERGAQAGGQCALARAVDPLDDDEHSASVARCAVRTRQLPRTFLTTRDFADLSSGKERSSECCGHKPNLLWNSLQ
jgi:hypothetical protein